MAYEHVIYQNCDGLAKIRIDRPKKLNALNSNIFSEIENVLVECEEDPAIRVVIIAGHEKAFGAGADVEPMSNAGIAEAFTMTDQSQKVFRRLAQMGKPTIAAIAGYALGGGLELALCCDFRIAADNAVFGLPEINLGLIPGGGGTQRLARLIGESRAKEMIFLGKNIKASRAEEWGLVNMVTPFTQLEVECEKLAHILMAKSSVAMRAAKMAVSMAMNVGIEEGIKIEQNAFCMLFGTSDQKEGIRSFMNKRKPIFTGK